MKVAVTGSAGHVGGNLVRLLLERGHAVRALVRSDTRPLDGLPVEVVQVDLFDGPGLTRAFDGCEVVFHLAALVSIDGDPDGSVRRTNVEGTRSVLAAARAASVRRVVHFSSIHALQHPPLDRPLDETRPLADSGHCLTYDASKAGGERAVLAAVAEGLDAVIVNPTGILGPIDYKPSPMGALTLKLARGQMPALVDAGFNWVDVRDVSLGALRAAEVGRSGERYLLGGAYAHVIAIADLVARATGRARPRLVSPLWLAAATAPLAVTFAHLTRAEPLFTPDSMETLKLAHHDIRTTKAQAELGWKPRPLEETVLDAVRWFKDNGRL